MNLQKHSRDRTTEQIGMTMIVGICAISILCADEPTTNAVPKKTAKSIRLSPTEDRDLGTNLVAYWRFDEGMGKSVFDSAGNYTGTLHNVSAKLWAIGKTSVNFFSFDGKAYAEIAKFPFMETGPGKAITIAGWIKPTDGFIISKNLNDSGTNFEFGISVDQGQLVWHGAGAVSGHTFLRLDNGAWHNFAVVLDDDTGTWFVDGEEDATFRINEPNHEQKVSLIIGACHTKSRDRIGVFYKGGMRDLCIYNGALTSSSISRLADNK